MPPNFREALASRLFPSGLRVNRVSRAASRASRISSDVKSRRFSAGSETGGAWMRHVGDEGSAEGKERSERIPRLRRSTGRESDGDTKPRVENALPAVTGLKTGHYMATLTEPLHQLLVEV